MPEFITQPIPGYITPEDQIALAIDIIQSAADLLQFSERNELERGIGMIRKPLLCLVAAGALAEITFAFHDTDSVCGVTVAFDAYTMEDFEAVNLSRLRLAASPTGTGSIELVCQEGAVTDAFLMTDWLPPTHPNLAWYQVQQNEGVEESQLLGEAQ
jgi:hypothetical protein